jgi:dihydropteroate synthase
MLWHHATGVLDIGAPRVVGIVNATPDSFSDGGRLGSLDDARRYADRLITEGADRPTRSSAASYRSSLHCAPPTPSFQFPSTP